MEEYYMNILGFNGSPRKNWNTSILLNKSLEGAASHGANTELINLYDMNYKGCISCFACKTIGSKSYGKCPINDDLKSIFKNMKRLMGWSILLVLTVRMIKLCMAFVV